MRLLLLADTHLPRFRALPPGVWDKVDLLNPGSPTDRRRQPACTFMTATANDGSLCDVVLHAL